MKDGTTHLAYKVEHVIDLHSGVLMAAETYRATEADTATLEGSVVRAQMNQQTAGSEQEIKDVVAVKGDPAAKTFTSIAEQSTIRTAI